ALPFSLAARLAAGQPRGRMIAHAFWRAAILAALGIWLRSISHPQTYFTFEDTLTQIGLGYGFLFLLGLRPVRDQWIALALSLIAGGVLRSPRPPSSRGRWFLAAGFAGLASGWLLGVMGICPVVKRIWTPSFTLWSGGWCFLLLAAFYVVIDVLGRRRWAFPLIVIGTNSIAAYLMSWLFMRFVETSLVTHLGEGFFHALGDAYA